MTTIDLSTPSPPPSGLLDALPRRVALTLPELLMVAERAGGAPLPFDVQTPADAPLLEAALDVRLGASPGAAESTAYRDALTALHDPVTSLTRRGLMVGDHVDDALSGAVGLLATPTVALDLDVAVDTIRAKAWHRQAGGAVASLATGDGLVFELAWFPTSAWAGELSRVAVVPEEVRLRTSSVPDHLDLPYALADAAVEASGSGRSDLLHLLVAEHSGQVLTADGTACSDFEVAVLLPALANEARGRIRALVADVTRDGSTVVGVRSWVLLADGWRTLHPRAGGTRVVVRRIEPSELAADLAPVLSEVTS